MRIPIEMLSSKNLAEIDACMRCGECTKLCFMCEMDYHELTAPRGKMTLLRNMIRRQYGLKAKIFGPKEIDEKEFKELMEHFYKCTICGQCQEVCPANIQTRESWEDFRHALFISTGLAPMEVHRPFINSILEYNNPWQQSPTRRARWTRRLEFQIKKLPEEKAQVLYFVGCTASYDTNIRIMALSTARLLKAAGVDFGIMGNDERCCNSTMLRVGLKEEFMRKSKENIEVLNSTGVDIIVTSCAGCYKTLKHDYKKVGTIDAEILHSVQFFSELIEDGKLKPISPIPDRVAFHDPCHLGRHSRVFESPRDILTAIPKLDLVEMDRSRKMSRCCGAGAGVKSAFPDIATRAAEIRVSDALKVDASLLTSACPFCYQSLRDASLRMGKIEMRDLTELLIQSVSGTK